VRARILLLLAAGAAALGVALLLVQSSPQVRAGPRPPVTELDVAALRDSGRALTLVNRSVAGVPLVEVVPAGGATRTPRLIAAAPDGLTLALSTVDPGVIGPLTLARADGSQLEIDLPGIRAAAFEPGGAWLVAIDLAGALWRVDSASGASARLSDGPYGPDPSVLADGRILVVRLSAVDAPLWAAAETVDGSGVVVPWTGAVAADAQLVYGATPLADGTLVLVRHRIGGGVAIVRLDHRGGEAAMAELDGAATVAVSSDGHWLAWPAAGRTWLAAIDDVAEAVAIGDGSPVRFSPDGSLLLVLAADAAVIVDRAGKRIDQAKPGACWVGGGRGCRP
jgi:hypothetical protein